MRTPKLRLTMPVVAEHDVQRSVVRVLRLELGTEGRVTGEGVCWFSIDHATDSWATVGERAGRGVAPGIPDMLVLYQGRAYWIELKTRDGTLDGGQRTMAASLLLAGCRIGVAIDVGEVIALLDEWQIPRKRRVKLQG